MKMRRALQITLAILASLVALCLIAASVMIFVPLAKFNGQMPTEQNLGCMYGVICGIYDIFSATDYLSTMQIVVLELVSILPVALLLVACVLLYNKNLKLGVHKLGYVLAALGILAPTVYMCLFSDKLFAYLGETKWLVSLFVSGGIAIVYLLLVVLTWIVKPAKKADEVVSEQIVEEITEETEQVAEDEQPATEQIADEQPVEEVEENVASEQPARQTEEVAVTDTVATEERKPVYTSKTLKKVRILHTLHNEKIINKDQYVALIDYVLK